MTEGIICHLDWQQHKLVCPALLLSLQRPYCSSGRSYIGKRSSSGNSFKDFGTVVIRSSFSLKIDLCFLSSKQELSLHAGLEHVFQQLLNKLFYYLVLTDLFVASLRHWSHLKYLQGISNSSAVRLPYDSFTRSLHLNL